MRILFNKKNSKNNNHRKQINKIVILNKNFQIGITWDTN